MKLKYYLRGLGIGIVVTAIIMSFTKKPEELTDAEIKIRAAKLGMVEENVLADIAKNNQKNTIDLKQDAKEAEENTVKAEEKTDNTPEAETADNMTEAEENIENSPNTTDVESEPTDTTVEIGTEPADTTIETEKEPTDTIVEIGAESEMQDMILEPEVNGIGEQGTVESYIVITIEAGNGSEVVCQKLFEAGLVNSPVEYNRYLMENGYDKKLRSGNHEIPAGASEEEMAKILCGIN